MIRLKLSEIASYIPDGRVVGG